MIPYYILAIEDETDRAYMTALFFQYQKLMYSTIQKVTNDHWLIDDIFQTSFEHLIGKIRIRKRTCCGRFRYGAYFCRGNEEDGNV